MAVNSLTQAARYATVYLDTYSYRTMLLAGQTMLCSGSRKPNWAVPLGSMWTERRRTPGKSIILYTLDRTVYGALSTMTFLLNQDIPPQAFIIHGQRHNAGCKSMVLR